jgi:hypothetical protein
VFHELETHPENARGSKYLQQKKEAPYFTNQKRTSKMEGAQKTSHKKRGIVFHESEKHPENARGSKDLPQKKRHCVSRIRNAP